jgi:hypothetical protein
LRIPAKDPRRFGSPSGRRSNRVRFSPLGVPESLKSSEQHLLFVVRHLIEDIHIRFDCLRWLAPASIENGAPTTRAAEGAWSLFITVFNVLIASAVFSLAAALTSTIADLASSFAAFIAGSSFGRPLGFALFLGLKLVERLPPLTA